MGGSGSSALWGFNPRPLLLTGESPAPAPAPAPVQFQSTPVIANGRIFVGAVERPLDICGFNPRPLLLTGESRAAGKVLPFTHPVSIHARYC